MFIHACILLDHSVEYSVVKIFLITLLAMLHTVAGIHQKRLECPLDSCQYITQNFSDKHHAIDFGAKIGDPIYAADDGLIYRAGENCATDPCDLAITMLHDGGELATNYWHLKDIFVKQGDIVRQGNIIGTVGMTGITSGPHLHFSVQLNRNFVNPTIFL
jgi:murein DD-endopeptidase MepM/ murein hydrolase activator NlpD